MPLTRYDTAANIINGAVREMGLGAAVSDPVAAVDAMHQQLAALLTDVGRQLARDHEWRHLIVAATLAKVTGVWVLPTGWSVVAGTADDLSVPPDFLSIVDQTSWNQSARLPVGGPMTPQVWEYRKATPVGNIFAEFRTDTNRIRFLPTPLSNYTIALEYRSRAWVIPAATPLGDGTTLGPDGSDEVLAAGDKVLFDPELVQDMLKLAWKREKHLDTATAQEDVDNDLRALLSAQSGGRVLNLVGPSANVHLVDARNLPDSFGN